MPPDLAPFDPTADDPVVARLEFTLSSRRRKVVSDPDLVPAAVAIPLVADGGGGLSVLFTVRTREVEHHKGEISFPGGRADPEDGDALETALRETREEIGVAPEDLRVIGTLDDLVSITGYRVTPFVVLLARSDYPFRPEPHEVAQILLVPLTHLLEPIHHRRIPACAGTGRPGIHEYRWKAHRIWGLTGEILHGLLGALSSGYGAAQ